MSTRTAGWSAHRDSAAPRIIQIVNNDFGIRNTMGARAWHIARAWAAQTGASEPGSPSAADGFRPDDLLVFARGSDAAAAREFPVRRCGLGSLGSKALAALQLYLWHGFPHKTIRDRAFHRSVERGLLATNPSRLRLVHSWVAVSAELARLRQRVPGLVTLYDTSMTPDQEQVQHRFAGFDYFLAPSPVVAEGLTRWGVDPSRIFQVPFGVDVELFQPAPDWPARLDPTGATTSGAATPGATTSGAKGPAPLRVAFTGQLSARKGIPELLQAWDALMAAPDSAPHAELHLYGRVYPEVRSQLIELDRRHIVLHGFVDLTAELPANHLYVLPSHREGSAKSVYEALACGLPVITTEETGSVVRDGVEGFIVPAGDPQTLATRLSTLLTDTPLRLRMATAARTRSQEFTWQRYGESVVNVYRNLLE
ncbi:MAG: glycosyltransferase [Spirochaetaceae bacterium]|nr:MAG: glycosyltransferase [Spirochaetaceae bacterium]